MTRAASGTSGDSHEAPAWPKTGSAGAFLFASEPERAQNAVVQTGLSSTAKTLSTMWTWPGSEIPASPYL